uniref:Uncharacterized protein n=1 Tax=Oryza glumipatula TaxID=40148 RepID=A0A0E0B812_9ORYZ
MRNRRVEKNVALSEEHSHQHVSNPLVNRLAVRPAGALTAACVGRRVHRLRRLPACRRRENGGEHEQEQHQCMGSAGRCHVYICVGVKDN